LPASSPCAPARVHYARPSADLLLTSAYGRHLIAIVLSRGRYNGVDGAEGVLRVHEPGGIVVVQDPASCLRSGMPVAAIATGVADYVLLDCPTWSGGSTRPLLAG
jgi:two-component system, chemotaxis family, protein-glutamate methylesterase/glutaminase